MMLSQAYRKLKEIDDKFHLLKQGRWQDIMEIGAHQGGWTQYAYKKARKILCIDWIIKNKIQKRNIRYIECDVFSLSFYRSFDIVLSDLCHNMSGDKYYDGRRLACFYQYIKNRLPTILKKGGCLVCKYFNYTNITMENFRTIKHIKLRSSKDRSSEMYIICKGYELN
ncbi:SAM-dependent methyltransferase [Candidatus Vidania fulgoroideorum]